MAHQASGSPEGVGGPRRLKWWWMWNQMKKPPSGLRDGCGEGLEGRVVQIERMSAGRWREGQGRWRGAWTSSGGSPSAVGSAESPVERAQSQKLLLQVLGTKTFYEERPENSCRFPAPMLRPKTSDNQLKPRAARSARGLGDATRRPRSRPGWGRSSAPGPATPTPHAGLCSSQLAF